MADLGPGPPVSGSLALTNFGPGPPASTSPALINPSPSATGSLALADFGLGRGPPTFGSLALANLVSSCLATEFHALADLGPGPLATGSLALADLGPGHPATGPLILADLGPGPPVTGSFALADLGPGPPVAGSPALVDFNPGLPAAGSLANTDSDSSASVFLLFLSLVHNLTFLGYFALCDLVPTSPTAKSLTLLRSVNVLVYTEYGFRTCLVTSTAPTVMLFFLESLHIPGFSESITHADPILGFPVIDLLMFWVFLISVHASNHAQFISQVASGLERSISGFLISLNLDVSSAGYTTAFIFSVYLTPFDFNLAFLWYISISPGLYLFSIKFSALFESRLVLGRLAELRD